MERGQKWSSVVDAIKKGASATEKAANSAIKSAHAAITNVISDTNDAINDARTVAKKVISDTINDARTVANNVLNSKASTDIIHGANAAVNVLHQSTNAAVNGANSVVSNVASVLEGKLPVNSAWDNIVNVWSSEMKKVEASIEAVKQRSMSIVEDYRYTAECKNPSTYAAKCTEPTGYDTFVSLLTLSANLISNEPLPSNFEQVTDSLMKSEFPIGFLGHSLAAGDFNGDGIYDLASGAWGANVDDGSAPQSGAVYLSYGNADGTLQSPATLRSSFPYKYGHDRFGWSVVALDYNGDGIDDLAVSSPSAQDWEAGFPIPPDPRQAVFLYQGRVEIFLGTKNGLQTTSSTVISTRDPTTNLGLVLKALDVNGDGLKDLCVGNPLSSYPTGPNREERLAASPKSCDSGNGDCDINKGSLMVFFSSADASTSGANNILDAADADIVLGGPRQYDLFASDMDVVDGLLLVGAPGKRIPARKTDTKPIRVNSSGVTPMWWENMPWPAGER